MKTCEKIFNPPIKKKHDPPQQATLISPLRSRQGGMSRWSKFHFTQFRQILRRDIQIGCDNLELHLIQNVGAVLQE